MKNKHISDEATLAVSFFLKTMNKLAEGEIPIHKDIDMGRNANRMLYIMAGLLFAYIIGLVFFTAAGKDSHTPDIAARPLLCAEISRGKVRGA